ncbi:MAG: hypothetical protein Q9177_005834, partial [Variospora cf. flavescens]
SNELSNPAIARFFARPGQNLVDIVLSSPRYRHCSKNMCQPVSRRDFAGCWFVQNSITICMPPSSADVTIFFLHGGGYFTLQPGHYLLFVLRIAEAILDQGLTVSVFALDYALAPERQYPTQLAEAAAAYEYIVNEAKVRPEKIIVAGDSAGGHLALSLLGHLHKPNPAIPSPRMTLPKPGGLVLISAWVSLYHESPSYVSNARTDIVTAKFVRRLRAQFLDGYRKSLKSPQDFDKDLCYLEFLDPHPPIDWVSVLPPWVWACAGSDEIFFDSNETWIATVQKELPEESVTFDVGSGMEHDWQFSETMIDESQKKTFLEGKAFLPSLFPCSLLLEDVSEKALQIVGWWLHVDVVRSIDIFCIRPPTYALGGTVNLIPCVHVEYALAFRQQKISLKTTKPRRGDYTEADWWRELEAIPSAGVATTCRSTVADCWVVCFPRRRKKYPYAGGLQYGLGTELRRKPRSAPPTKPPQACVDSIAQDNTIMMPSVIDDAALPSRSKLANIDQSQIDAKLPRLTPRKKAPPPQNPLPVPETPDLPPPPDQSSLCFHEPTRRILSPHDHELFYASPTYKLILSFVFSLSEAAASKKISSITAEQAPGPVKQIISVLSSVEDTINQCPPADQGGSRFGNPAFRDFLNAVSAQSSTWHSSLGLTLPSAITETSTYLQNSFGNRTRIDYGSGHELSFIIWLLCLNRLSLLPPSTFPALTLLAFPRYITLMQKIQSTYYLEPAGSHGVWGLDDYHFLPFLFGASQLLRHPYIRPLSIHNELVLEEEGDDYLYLSMVRETMASKSVKGLKWTQPMLDDISGAKNWEKVEQGMRRMFVKEVLGKLPVMQHFLFGGLVPAAEGMSREGEAGVKPEAEESEGGEVAVDEDGARHVHRDDAWGDCCGIKIPSTVAANQEARKKGEEDGLRRIPFD